MRDASVVFVLTTLTNSPPWYDPRLPLNHSVTEGGVHMAKYSVLLKQYFNGTGSGEVRGVVEASSKEEAARLASKAANEKAMDGYSFAARLPAERYVQEVT